MKTMTKNLSNFAVRTLTALVMLTAPVTVLWAQKMNDKFSMTTQMFLNELKEQADQPSATPRHTPVRRTPDGRELPKARRLIASPDTVAGKVYISCFIHLKDVSNLSEVRSLGVEIEESFDGLDFVTARVPVDQLEALANIDNVTKIKVAQQMRPMTDVARQKTNVDDLLTLSNDATAAGITTKYDGTGVVLGVIDTGIDFQHIAFKDKDGNSRIKRAYVYNGSTANEYTSITSNSPTTDDSSEDHGTHTATTAGGSSVIVNGSTVTVTDNHANATYGGIAPCADLYLAGINGLSDTYLTNALKKMVTYADEQGKPLVVSNSWGSSWGPRTGTGTWATLVGQYFGDSHPNHVILFAASNDAGHENGNEGGGYFVKKSSASSSSPLGTIIRTDGEGGDYYQGLIACAWNASNSTKLNCIIHVLNSSGTILNSWTVTTNGTSSFSGLSNYYSGSMTVYIEQENGKYRLALYSANGITSKSSGSYTLAIEVYPSSGSANINMWSGDWSFFTDNYTTSGHTWLDGTDDMCVSDEATIPNAISIGAYVSKKSWKASNNKTYTSSVYTVDDIAYFSSYATADQSPTGLAYPWISAPGARLAAGVNHYHTASVDDYSYYGSDYSTDLVVNNSNYPYAMMEGTSMATPVAAGIVALWLQAAKSVNVDLTVNDVKTIMEQTAINDSYTTTGANASHFGKGKIDALAGIQYILGSSSSPLIKAEPTSIDFADKNPYATRSYTKTLNVKGTNLEGDITATLSDANGVYSLSQTSITQSAAEASGGVDITITYAPQVAGTHDATITLTSSNATSVEVPLTATAQAATPYIFADPETLNFTAGLNESKSLTFDVLSEFLTGDVAVTLNDANNVFSIDKTSITKADSEEGATVTVTFQSANAGAFNGTVTLSSAGAENVVISLSGTASITSDETIDFTAQGYSNETVVTSVSGTNCTVSFDKGTNSNAPKYYTSGTAIRVYGGNTMTIASTTKTISKIELTFGSSDGSNAITTDVESYSNGTWTGSASSVTFTVGGTSGNRRIQKVKVTYAGGTTPVTKQDVTMSFSPTEVTATVGESFTAPTLTTDPTGLTVTYSSSDTGVATVDSSTGAVTLVAAGTTTITATFAGNDSYNGGSASYTLTVSAASTPSNNQLLYEGLSEYDSENDGTNAIGKTYQYLDYKDWNTLTKIYAGGTSNAQSNGGCLKFGSSSDAGVMTTKSIALTGTGTLTFYLRKYGSDNGSLSVSVTGATATNTSFSASDTWTLCTTNLTGGNGSVTITLTSTKRVYVDEITLVSGSGSTPSTTVAAPTISGTTPFVHNTEVTITAESGASIYYTLDGTTPSSSSTQYSEPFTLTATKTVKAIAVKNNTSSDVTTKTFTAYYQNANNKNGEQLKTSMCEIIYNRTEQTYNSLWTAFQTTDVRSDGKIWDMYSNITNYVPGGSAQGANYSAEGNSYNREHSFPKSWFGGEVTPMYTDLHHMYPTDGFVNNKRANYPFGETNGTGNGSYQSNNGFSKLGLCTYPGYNGTVFEPADEYKGDFARTYFYMVTCYEEKLHDWVTNYGSDTEVDDVLDGKTYPGLTTWQLNMLMEWAKNDPVSEKETNRNNAVYAIQNNRNPFIDYPGLQEYIWGICTNDAFSYDNYVEPVYTIPVTVPTLAIGNVTSISAEASWNACDNVSSYTLQLASDDQFTTGGTSGGNATTILSEDFSGVTSTGTAAITNFDDCLGTTGWSGESVYPNNGNVRLGKSSGAGSLQTPSLSASGSVTVEWDAYQWSGDNTSIYVGVSKNGGTSFDEEEVSLTDTPTSYSKSFTINGNSVIVRWRSSDSSKQRFYLDNITISSGGSSNTGTGIGSLIAEETVSGTSYTFSNLSPETTYYARVKGNADWSNIVNFTTLPETVSGIAPSWSNFPTTHTMTVGESYTLNVNNYVSGDPTPTVTCSSTTAGSGDYTFANGTLTFTPSAAGTYSFTFTAENNVGEPANTTLTVTVNEASTPEPLVGSGKYALVTNASSLATGDKILIAYVNDNNNTAYVLSTTQNTNNRAATSDVTLSNSNGLLTPGDAAQVITLEKDESNFLFNVGNGYLYAASSSKNYLRTEENFDDNAKATISIANTGNATITFQGSNSNKLMRYNPNNGSPIFSCYASNTTTGSAPQIYREILVPAITLNNDGTGNSDAIEDNNGDMVNVTLANRTLWKDGDWNTLCLPFAMSADEIAASDLAGADIRTLSTASFSNGTLTLNFTPETGSGAVTSITAGTPYIIKWASSNSNIVNPVFKGVTIDNTTNDNTQDVGDGNAITFRGTYTKLNYTADDQSILFMGSGSTLYYPENGATIGAQRAYFELTGFTAGTADTSNGIRSFVLNFGDDVATGIINANGFHEAQEGWYDLNGRKLSGKPVAKGIYIHNGNKTIIK